MKENVVELRAVVWHSMGFWVASCPRPWCVNTEWSGPGPTSGRVGGLGRDVMRCLRCGLACPADWPDNPRELERVLQQRPFAETRNWLPGETLEDLIAENIEHGLVDPAELLADPAWNGIISNGGALTSYGRDLITSGPGPLAIGGQ